MPALRTPALHQPAPPRAVQPTSVQHAHRKPRTASKRYSLRLPVGVAAPLEALCELHPAKKRSQIIADLLALALERIEHPVHGTTGPESGFQADVRQHVYLLSGPFAEFRGLVQKHHRSIERQLGNVREEDEMPTDNYSLDASD